MKPTAQSTRSVIKAGFWLLGSLVSLALLSQPGASHDELNFHAPSIWCARGVELPNCDQIVDVGNRNVLNAYTNLEGLPCKKDTTQPLVCPASSGAWNETLSNRSLYPNGFYWLLSWFVVSSASLSIVLVRVINALLITLMVMLMFHFLPTRYRMVLYLTVLTSFQSTGFFLVSSLNPSSWTSIGSGLGWLCLHAALVQQDLSKVHRCILVVIAIVTSLMAVTSRPDGLLFASIAVIMCVAQVSKSKFEVLKTRMLLFILLTGSSLVALQAWSPLQPLTLLKSVFSRAINQPGMVIYWTNGLLEGLPNAVGALSSVPTHSPMAIPNIVGLCNVVLLALLMALARNTTSRDQVLGFSAVMFLMAIAGLSQIDLVSNKSSGSEGRYLYPLLVFMIAWWYQFGPANFNMGVLKYLKPASIFATCSYALVAFSIAERFTDVQTGGLRFIPEGPDNWWWEWMPIGPNVVLILGVFAMWKFFEETTRLMNHSELLVPG